MPLPSPRPELSTQLLDAIRRRDPDATGRLIRQWVHRHGVAALATFRHHTVIPQEGQGAADWLQQLLEAGTDRPQAITPALALAPPLAQVAAAPALPDVALLRAIPASTLPAPAPANLADLRSWLSGSPQHRRAS